MTFLKSRYTLLCCNCHLYICFDAGRPHSIHRQFSRDRPDLMRQRTFSTGSRSSHDAPVSPQPPGSPRAGKRDPLRQFSVMSQGTNSEDEEKEKKAGER